MTSVGVAAGLLASCALVGTLKRLLFGVAPTDATTFVMLSVVLALVAMTASVIPALRATHTDPMQALRGDA